MYKSLAVGLVVAGALVPAQAAAAVLINEIAWMGTGVDNGSFCEWVELANDGVESVTLSGWTLKTLDGGMTVSLTGSIDAGGFYLIERATPSACPDPVPGIDADLARSYGGGLSNAGEILVLANAGVEVDRIDASGGWEKVVGGDSVQKYTAQRNGTTWVTAVATPRSANATESVVVATPTSSGSTPAAKKVVGNPVPTLLIETGGDRVVSTKTHTRYQPIVYDSFGKHVPDAQLSWAFGDGSKHSGEKIMHMYREDGEYLVVVHAQQRYSHGIASFVVFADSPDVEIVSLSEKGIGLQNKDTRILDLSRYELAAGKHIFRIPEYTSILPGRTVIFSPEVTRLSTTTPTVQLRYPSGEVAFSYVQASSTAVLQPGTPGSGTNLLRAVETLVPKETLPHDPAVIVPARTVNPVGAGTRSTFRTLLAPLRLGSRSL